MFFIGSVMKIKICGITKPEEVTYLTKNGVDFAGVVMFYDKSKRSVTPQIATEIVRSFKSSEEKDNNIKVVAVMVSPSIDEIKTANECGFDYVQIHGDLSEEMINESPLPILKAFNVSDIDKYDFFCSFEKIKGFVFDAGEPGSGKTFDWEMLKSLKRRDDKLFILAGGLTKDNVARAISDVNPDGVDVSSAVEICKELPDKDCKKIDEFVLAVRNNS